eukprot:758317-Hanusia_phi.AAC.13
MQSDKRTLQPIYTESSVLLRYNGQCFSIKAVAREQHHDRVERLPRRRAVASISFNSRRMIPQIAFIPCTYTTSDWK